MNGEQDVRRRYQCIGIVQGVGFRPFLHRLASDLGLVGIAYNTSVGVTLELQGSKEMLREVQAYVTAHKPPLAVIDSMESESIPIVPGETTFSIISSEKKGRVKTFIGSDMGLCEACEKELLDAHNRRYEYPFITCTNCGPRYTIIESIPYDRQATSMKEFAQCTACIEEYTDLMNRRYHAEPNGCSDCGPSYRLVKKGHSTPNLINPIEEAHQMIKNGAILAVKGIGGYHLVCDATNEKSVRTLRERKGRPTKPFAIMAGSLDRVRSIAYVSEKEEQLLTSQERPIVILRSKKVLQDSVAPHMTTVGVMLPYAPIHYVLLPQDALWVMTSANYSGESLVYKDEKAFIELEHIVDGWLLHNREIVASCDDSLVAVHNDEPLLIRRSRGYVPKPLYVRKAVNQSILAMGGDLKNVFSMNKGAHVLLGPHIGDLGNISTHTALEEAIQRYMELFDIRPEMIVGDYHPSYFSSALGKRLSEEWCIPYREVQHHEAHIGSVICDRGLSGQVLGICFDGTGYGTDHTIWGGEFIIMNAETGKASRVCHLKEAPLWGGEMAVREPWRQALWYFYRYGSNQWKEHMHEWISGLPAHWGLLETMFSHPYKIGATSMGRLFDAVGSMLGLGYSHSYDGEIAITLEQISSGIEGHVRPYQFDGTILNMEACIDSIVQELEAFGGCDHMIRSQISADFHETLGAATVEVGRHICKEYPIDHVVLCGGVFQNRRLYDTIQLRWTEQNIIIPNGVPLNDGGLALGQLWLGGIRERCV